MADPIAPVNTTAVAPTTIVLSPRELQILGLAAEGASNAEIGARLFVSEHTVKTHVRRLFKRLGARNRAHAVHLAHLAGVHLPNGSAAPRGVRPRRGRLARPEPGVTWVGDRANRPACRPPVTTPTHVLRVVNPAGEPEQSPVGIAVRTDDEARLRLRQLAGWVFPPQRVLLHRAGEAWPMAHMQGFRR